MGSKSLKDLIDGGQVQEHLERVLASEAFRGSRRSQDFLRWVVRRTLDGHVETVKERNIAVEVFARPEDYNSAEDSFVRVKAGEVRRRLAAYYRSPDPADRLRIELPLGSYVPRFESLEPPTGAESEKEAEGSAAGQRRRGLWAAAGVVLLLAAVATLWVHRPVSALDQFWQPILDDPEPLLIFLPIPVSYQVVSETEARRVGEPLYEVLRPEAGRRFLVQTPHKVGLGAAVGAIRFVALCKDTGKPYVLKSGHDLSFADLRNQPAVLFGAFSSPWVVEMNNEHRFRLIQAGSCIQDGQNAARQWRSVPGRHTGSPLEDYSIASRIIDSKSGRKAILAAGISTFGTQAAAEFLTDPERLKELARKAPNGVITGNFQVVLHTKIIGNTPARARIVDTHFW